MPTGIGKYQFIFIHNKTKRCWELTSARMRKIARQINDTNKLVKNWLNGDYSSKFVNKIWQIIAAFVYVLWNICIEQMRSSKQNSYPLTNNVQGSPVM